MHRELRCKRRLPSIRHSLQVPFGDKDLLIISKSRQADWKHQIHPVNERKKKITAGGGKRGHE